MIQIGYKLSSEEHGPNDLVRYARLAEVHLPCDPLNPRHGDRGEKRHPSRDTVIRLGLAMQLPIEDLDELLLAAGYAPLVR